MNRLVIVKDIKGSGYTAFLKNNPEIIIESESLEKIPQLLSKALELLLKLDIEEQNYLYEEF